MSLAQTHLLADFKVLGTSLGLLFQKTETEFHKSGMC